MSPNRFSAKEKFNKLHKIPAFYIKDKLFYM